MPASALYTFNLLTEHDLGFDDVGTFIVPEGKRCVITTLTVTAHPTLLALEWALEDYQTGGMIVHRYENPAPVTSDIINQARIVISDIGAPLNGFNVHNLGPDLIDVHASGMLLTLP